jgi:RNA recognition motif-containing protein
MAVQNQCLSQERYAYNEFINKILKDYITSHPEELSRILWVGNISEMVTEENLAEEFAKYGKIESIRILHGRYCAFVNFEKEEDAKSAKTALHGAQIGGQHIVINYRKVCSKFCILTFLAGAFKRNNCYCCCY